MGKYTLIGIICYMLLGMGLSMTTEDTEINESLLDMLDNENPNLDALLSEAKKYGLLDTGKYETPVYLDRKDNLCLNVQLMKGNDTKLAINKEIQRLYVQVPSKYIFPSNEEMIKYLASVLNVSRDSLHVADNFANRRTVVVSSHLSSSDIVDTIVAVSSGNILSGDGNTIYSMNTDELKTFIREKRITLPPDLHKIKPIDKGDVERLTKIFGMEPPPSVVTRKTTEKSKTIESLVTQKVSIREESPEEINEKSELENLNTETVSEKATIEVTKTLENVPTKARTRTRTRKAVKNTVAKSTSKLRNTVKPKMGAKKGKRKTKSKVLTRKPKKSKTVESHVTQKVSIREDSVEQIKEERENENLNTETETETGTMEQKKSRTKTVKNKVTKGRSKLKKTVKSKVGAKKGKRKTESGVGKTKSKTKTKGKVKKTKATTSKTRTRGMPKTTKAKIKTKSRTKKVKPKRKKEICPRYIPVIYDDQDNVVIKVKVTRGNSNKLLKVENKRETKLATVKVQIQAPMYQEAFENEMSRYMSQVLGVSRKYIKLHTDKNQNIKKVEIPNEKLEVKVAKRKLKDAFNGIHKFSLIQ